MTAIDSTPANKNFLSPLNFKFQIKKAPYVNFFIQKVNIPSIALPNIDTANPFVTLPYPGEHIRYGTLDISFKVDEDLQNYLEIHNWLVSLGKPENFDQYKQIQDIDPVTGNGIYSDISLHVLSSTKMPNYEITFIDAFPISLSDISFNTVDNDVNFIQASASFKYNYYKIIKTT
jgi:hypothetical protein